MSLFYTILNQDFIETHQCNAMASSIKQNIQCINCAFNSRLQQDTNHGDNLDLFLCNIDT